MLRAQVWETEFNPQYQVKSQLSGTHLCLFPVLGQEKTRGLLTTQSQPISERCCAVSEIMSHMERLGMFEVWFAQASTITFLHYLFSQSKPDILYEIVNKQENCIIVLCILEIK